MGKVLVSEENLTNIANAIRSKAGTEDTFKPGEMATAIESIESGGGSNITKGVIINSCDAEGYPTNISVVGMTEIPDRYFYYAFYSSSSGQDGLLHNVGSNLHLPNNLTEIGNYSFYRCQTLAIKELPDSVTKIGSYAFHSCSNLALTKLPEKLTSIPDYCFYKCAKLALTRLPDGITGVATYSFDSCSNLTLTELPSGVTYIGANVFSNCTSLPSMTCLGDVTYIGSNTFMGCSNLSYFALPNVTTVPFLCNSVFVRTPIANGTGYIYVPDALVENFKAETEWCDYAEQIRPISSLNNILDLSQQQFPITTDGNITVDYDVESQTFTLNGAVEESHGFNIPITQELLGTYTLSYNNTETDRGFYISIDNNTETMLNGWGDNTKTFTLTEQPSQLMFWFDYSDSTPERNVYTDYKINLVLLEGENE